MPNANPLVQSQIKRETIVPLNRLESTYDDYFKELTKLQADDIIVRANCKFCTHPARAEAELRFEKSGHFVNVEHCFDDWNKTHPDAPVMNHQNIRNHIYNHYLQQQKRIWLREYSASLISVMNKRISDEQRLEKIRCQLEMKMDEVLADPTIEPLKAVDAISKLSKAIVDLARTLGELKGDIQTVEIVITKLSNTWERLIMSQQDPQMKRVLIKSLEFFQSDLEGIPLSEQE